MNTERLNKIKNHITLGEHEKARSLCKKTLRKIPQHIDVLQLLGVANLNLQRFEDAVKAFTTVNNINPKVASNHYNLGVAYLALKKPEPAANHFEIALSIQPSLACASRDLCGALKEMGRTEEAVQAGRRAIELAPNDPETNYKLASALHEWKDFEAAFKYYQRANELLPDNPAILFDLAQMHLGRGETDEAKRHFRRVIELYPREIESHRQLMRLTKYTSLEHTDIKRVKAMLNEKWLSANDKTAAYFMLSKAYRDCKMYDESFRYASEGNKIQDRIHKFDIAEFASYITRIIEFYSKDRISHHKRAGHESRTPIFIVGTPRSGTTLTEQILCGHSKVFGAGELTWVSTCANALSGFLKSSQTYPDCVSELDGSRLNELANKYLRYLRSLAGNQPFVTDKMPGNFLHLGLIHILFPNARIIHCQRERRDACVSMFLEYFPGVVPYSYNLRSLGAYYSEYLRIMEHWRKVIPQKVMLELRYENLVTEQETETARLLEFLDLEWEESCLHFYNVKRRVYTASHLQVSRPLYSTSIARWKFYEKHLKPLEEGFNYRNINTSGS